MRVALVHGFTQTAASWGPVRERLEAAGHAVVTPEVSGHGAQSERRADLVADADRLADEVSTARPIDEVSTARLADEVTTDRPADPKRPAVWVGYSMGGRVCLHVAVQRPEVVAGLVLISTTAGLDSDRERASRREADEALARSIELDGVDAFVSRWLQGPLWRTLPAEAVGADIRRTNSAAGLAASLRLAGTGAQESLWDHLDAIRCPVLVVTGDLDEKFTAIGADLARSLRHAPVTSIAIRGAGHAVPWEKPDELTATVIAWIDGLALEPAT